jgi:hypothetical protein
VIRVGDNGSELLLPMYYTPQARPSALARFPLARCTRLRRSDAGMDGVASRGYTVPEPE